ncbi:hypothetical protein KGD83_08735 [Nocardiopsis akebiae]|uniref:Uncharacterized protein n=1 Tax=Nocardiopsis akebiae TaxID=2831968 RepID=A0ABX8C826_9ACTN|nr:hypothetical protein [Nocardiopsis akebiae]QUX30575.1 hypothetical protein KGD83_08735 [Nocardiopsis akebiae]
MFATIAAVLFGLALLLELLGENIQDLVTTTTLALAGLLFLALHAGGYGSGWKRGRR